MRDSIARVIPDGTMGLLPYHLEETSRFTVRLREARRGLASEPAPWPGRRIVRLLPGGGEARIRRARS